METFRSFTSNNSIRKSLKEKLLGTKPNLKSISSKKSKNSNLLPESSKMPKISDPNDSLYKLKYYINTLKPYQVTNQLRFKMQKIKQAKYFLLKNFHTISLQNQKSREIYPYTETKKIIKTSPTNTRNISNENHINSTQTNTYYSSFPSEVSKIHNTLDNFYKNNKKNQSAKKNYEPLSFISTEPTYSKKGILKKFMENVRISTKDKFKNKILKFSEYKMRRYFEVINEQMKVELYQKNCVNFLFEKYTEEYHNYEKKIHKTIEYEKDINDDLRWKELNLKIDISKLVANIQKILMRISKFIEIKNFLIEMQIFSAKEHNSNYKQLIDMKNKLMHKTKTIGKILNRQILLLNAKELNLETFNELEKDLSKKLRKSIIKSKDNNQNFFPTLDDFFSLIKIMQETNVNLFIQYNYLKQNIASIKSDYRGVLTSYENENIEENLKEIMYKAKLMELKNLKEKNKELINKKNKIIEKERLKNKNENNKIKLKTYSIFYQLKINNLIDKNDLFIVYDKLTNDPILDTLTYLRVIESKINVLTDIKKDVLIEYPYIAKIVENECRERMMIKTKLKEQLKNKMIFSKTCDKINKTRLYFNKKKDYYFRNFNGKYKNKKLNVNVYNKNNNNGNLYENWDLNDKDDENNDV